MYFGKIHLKFSQIFKQAEKCISLTNNYLKIISPVHWNTNSILNGPTGTKKGMFSLSKLKN